MQQVATVSIPKPASKMEYLIDRDELLELKRRKLIDNKLYTYLALKLTYTTNNPSVHVESFCEQWGLTESQLGGAIASLQKKGALQPTSNQLQLELF